jgi:hypothetical protein
LLTPDLDCQAQEGQIHLQFFGLVSTLAGEVRCCLSRAGKRGCAVQHHVLLLQALPIALLASKALFFPSLLALVMCHGLVGLHLMVAVRSLSVVVAASVLSMVPTGVLAVLGL